MINGNPGIRLFVWEHFQNLNRVVQRMKYSDGTFSGYKSALCTREITVLGHCCTPKGRLLDPTKVDKVANWGKLFDLTDIHAFLGIVRVCRMFIHNFAHQAHHLTKLTRKDAPFEYGLLQIAVQEDLKQAILNSPALCPINYTSGAAVILLVDTSYLAVGYLLGQCDPNHTRTRYYAHFGSITLWTLSHTSLTTHQPAKLSYRSRR
jgi:hypothetical protein